MQSLFWFSLIVGGGMLLVSLLGDLFGGHDADLGMGGHDADLGLDHDVDLGGGAEADASTGSALVHASHAGAGAAHDAQAVRILSLRTITYFLFGFGAMGLLLGRADGTGSTVLLLLASTVGGLLAAGISVAAFAFVRGTEAGERQGEDSFVGLPARVVLPLVPGHAGRVLVRRGQREYELRARAFEADAASAGSDTWTDVVIVEMREGTALVSPFDPSLE